MVNLRISWCRAIPWFTYEPHCSVITIVEDETEQCEVDSQIIADIVEVLLGIHELVESSDPIVYDGWSAYEYRYLEKCKDHLRAKKLWFAAAFKPGHGPRISFGPGATN